MPLRNRFEDSGYDDFGIEMEEVAEEGGYDLAAELGETEMSALLGDGAALDGLVELPLIDVTVVAGEVTSSVLGIVGGVVSVVAILVPIIITIVRGLQNQISLDHVVSELDRHETEFDEEFSKLADILCITLSPLETVEMKYEVIIPTRMTMMGDPIGGGVREVKYTKQISRLWTHGPACKKYLEFRTSRQNISSPSDIGGTVSKIAHEWRRLLSPGPLLLNGQAQWKGNLSDNVINIYNSYNDDKIVVSSTKSWKQYLQDYSKIDTYLQERNGPEFQSWMEKLMREHRASTPVHVEQTTTPWSDAVAMYVTAHPDMTVTTSASLEKACN